MLFAAALATSAFGFGWGRGPGFDCSQCPGGDAAGYRGVSLTAEQKAKLKEMRDTEFAEIKPLQEQMFAKRDEVRKLWLAPNPDKAQITAAQQEMRALRDQLQDKMTAFRLNALNVLTPEQRSQLQSSMSGRGFRMHGMGPVGPGACGGCVGGGPGAR